MDAAGITSTSCRCFLLLSRLIVDDAIVVSRPPNNICAPANSRPKKRCFGVNDFQVVLKPTTTVWAFLPPVLFGSMGQFLKSVPITICNLLASLAIALMVNHHAGGDSGARPPDKNFFLYCAALADWRNPAFQTTLRAFGAIILLAAVVRLISMKSGRTRWKTTSG